MTTYIYGLLCPLENRIRYVGKSNFPKKRYSQHKFNCHARTYDNTHLKRWWLKLEALGLQPELCILEEVKADTWTEKEIAWIRHYGRENLCNKNDGGFEPPSQKGKPKSAETRAKLSAAKKGKPIWVGDKIHPMKGKSNPTKGSKRSQEFRDLCKTLKAGDKNPNFGKKRHLNLTKALLEATCKKVLLIDSLGETIKTYESCSAAQEDLGLNSGAVSRVCRGEYSQTKGYRFKYSPTEDPL